MRKRTTSFHNIKDFEYQNMYNTAYLDYSFLKTIEPHIEFDYYVPELISAAKAINTSLEFLSSLPGVDRAIGTNEDDKLTSRVLLLKEKYLPDLELHINLFPTLDEGKRTFADLKAFVDTRSRFDFLFQMLTKDFSLRRVPVLHKPFVKALEKLNYTPCLLKLGYLCANEDKNLKMLYEGIKV